MEHLAATYLRNNPRWKERIVYWGPMGCCTGNYLIVQGELDSADVVDLMRDTMDFIAGFEGEVPGASPRDCGNWSFMDLRGGAPCGPTLSHGRFLQMARPENLVYPQ